MRRIWITALCALAIAAASAVASPALAGSRGHATAQVSPRGFGTPAQIPWWSVGSAWVLTDWTAGVPSVHNYAAPRYLVLTSQSGLRYVVLKESGILAQADLLAWSGDGQRALFDYLTAAQTWRLLVVDLRSGTVADDFAVPRSFQSAAFTRPNGLALVVSTYTNHAIVTRYSLGGQPQVTYPSSFASIGKLNGSTLYKPDGSELALGAAHGLALVANDGTTVGELHLPGSSYCTPQSWWSATDVLAACAVGVHQESRLFEFPVTGGAPRALTRINVPPDYGDISGWHVATHVFVNVASACGYVYLAQLDGAAPIMVQVPGVPSAHSIHVIGATRFSLALTASVACHDHDSLLWYTPLTGSTRVVLGPPVTGGEIGVSLAYPMRFG